MLSKTLAYPEMKILSYQWALCRCYLFFLVALRMANSVMAVNMQKIPSIVKAKEAKATLVTIRRSAASS